MREIDVPLGVVLLKSVHSICTVSVFYAFLENPLVNQPLFLERQATRSSSVLWRAWLEAWAATDTHLALQHCKSCFQAVILTVEILLLQEF